MHESSDLFIIKSHTFPGQHIREYPAALASSQEDCLQLCAKQYIPRRAPAHSVCRPITLVGWHGNGLPKEAYEPLWHDLVIALTAFGIAVSSIWIADNAFQNHSRILNEHLLGNEPHWFDHSRDVLAMINHFRRDIKRPIVSIGHSIGADQSVALAHIHPRLFSAMILVEPCATLAYAPMLKGMVKSTLRRFDDAFPSQEAARASLLNNPLFAGWDARALKCYMDNCLRQGPTVAYPHNDTIFTTTTPKYAELMHLVRPNPLISISDDALTIPDPLLHPDFDQEAELKSPVYNHWIRYVYDYLRSLRPPVLYVIGRGSQIVRPGVVQERERITGIGPGGSGGKKCDMVATVDIDGGHNLPMINPSGLASACANFIHTHLLSWSKREDAWLHTWNSKSLQQKQTFTDEEYKTYMSWDGRPWPPLPVAAAGTKL